MTTNENQKAPVAEEELDDEAIRQAIQEADAMNLKEAGDRGYNGGGGDGEGEVVDPALMQQSQQEQPVQPEQPVEQEGASPASPPPIQQDEGDPYATYNPDNEPTDSTAQIEVNVNDNEGILSTLWNNLKEVPQSLAAGVKNGLNEMENTFIASPIKFLDDLRWQGWDKAEFGKDVDQWEQKTINILSPAEYKPQTTGGAIAEGAARFMTAFVPVMGGLGKLGKASEGVKYVSKALNNPYVKASVAGFAADFMTLTKQDSHIADLLDKNETFHNLWIVDKLKSKKDDTVVEAKLKGAIEGLGLGIATDYVIRTVGRCRRLFKSNGSQQAVEAEMRQATEEQAELMARQDFLDENEALARQKLEEQIAREADERVANNLPPREVEEEVIDIPEDIASTSNRQIDEVFDPETGKVGPEADFEDFSSEREMFDQSQQQPATSPTGAVTSATTEVFSPENYRVVKVAQNGAEMEEPFFFYNDPKTGELVRDDHWFKQDDGTWIRRNEADTNYSPSILYNPSRGELRYDIPPERLHSSEELNDIVLDAKTSPDEVSQKISYSPNLRMQVFDNPECPKTIIRLGDMLADNLKRNNPEHWSELVQDAESIATRTGSGINEQLSQLLKGSQALAELTRINFNCRQLYHSSLTELNRLGDQVLNGTANSLTYVQYYVLQQNVQRLHIGITNFGTDVGRALSSHRIPVTDEGAEKIAQLFKDKTDPFFGKWETPPRNMNEVEADKWLRDHGVDKEKILNCAKQASMGDRSDIAGQVNHIITVSKGEWTAELMKSSYLANLLSSPKTWAINGLSNAIKAFDRPLSNMLGGAMTLNKEAMTAGFDELAGMVNQSVASLKMFVKGYRANGSFITGEANQAALLERSNGFTDPWSGYSLKQQLLAGKPETTQLTPMQENLVTAFDYIGKSVNLPFKVLAGTDEVFKQLSFRAGSFSKLCAEARELGMSGTKSVYGYAKRNLQKYIDAEGKLVATRAELESKLTEDAKLKGLTKPSEQRKFVREAIDSFINVTNGKTTIDRVTAGKYYDLVKRVTDSEALLEQAKEATFTQSLGKVGSAIQYVSNSHPLMKIVLPFVRTPMNIMKDVLNHTPLAPMGKAFSAEYRQRFVNDKAFQAQELGKVAVGSLAMGLAGYLSVSGQITGSVPPNKKVAQYWRDAGYEPFSIRFGNRWISYGRLDPFGMLLGLTADTMEIMKTYPYLGDSEKDAMWGRIMAAHISNFTNKTYMQGLSQFLNFFTDADKRFDRYVGGIASNFIPAAAAVREVRKMMNPEMKELDNWVSFIKNSLPFANESLATRVSWITGKPDEYASFPSAKMDDKVLNELFRLGDGIIGAPSNIIESVKLSAEQYARFKELHATVKIGGLTLHQTLDRLFDKPEYDINRDRLGDTTYGEDGPREKVVNKVIKQYRDLAKYHLRLEFPELDHDIFRNEVNNAGASSGMITQQKGGANQADELTRQNWDKHRQDMEKIRNLMQ